MRRLISKCLGLGCALSAATAAAQGPGPTPTAATRRPAARLVAVQALTPANAGGLTARAQAGAPVPLPMPPGGSPMAPPTPPAGTLGMPRPFAQGPNVTELRTGAAPPAATFGAPMPFGTFPAGGISQPQPGVPVMAADGGQFPFPTLDAPLVGATVPGTAFPGAVAATTSACDKWYLSAEYLMWWTKSAGLPPLLTTGDIPSEGIIEPGRNTQVIFGGDRVNRDAQGGGRFGVGHWFGTEQRWGAEGSLFFLGTNTTEFRADNATFPVIARPFTIANNNQPFSELIATPDPLGVRIGSATATYDTTFWGAEANLRRFLGKTGCARLDMIFGFRYVQLNEQIRVSEFSVRPSDMVSGTVVDEFRAENDFYGGQVGLVGEVRRGRWFATSTGKIALGTVNQKAVIDGRQMLVAGGVPMQAAGGLLALPGANIGTYSQDTFAVVPELGLNIGYHLTPHCRIFVGYNFLYLSDVLRPGGLIDTGLDATRIPNFPALVDGVPPTRLPQPRPAVNLRDTDFFATGLSFGLQLNW